MYIISQQILIIDEQAQVALRQEPLALRTLRPQGAPGRQRHHRDPLRKQSQVRA